MWYKSVVHGLKDWHIYYIKVCTTKYMPKVGTKEGTFTKYIKRERERRIYMKMSLKHHKIKLL